MEMTLFSLKLGLLSFWGLWLLIAFLTNLCEWLKVMRIVPQHWTFASQNFQAVARATATYHAPPWIPRFLFLGILLWQLLTIHFLRMGHRLLCRGRVACQGCVECGLCR